MKKVLLSILTMIYLMASSGVAMEVHYCMGKKAGVDFYKTAGEKCSRCGMKEKKAGCCNDEHRFYKLDNAHKNVSTNYVHAVPQLAIVNNFLAFSSNIFSSFQKNISYNHSPPILTGPPVFLRNCVFRI